MYTELAEQKKSKEEKKEPVKDEPPPSVYNDRGEIRMMNQGKYEFHLYD